MAVRWAALSAQLWPIFAWRRSKSPQSIIHPFPQKFGKGTLMIASASLEKTMSQPSMVKFIKNIQAKKTRSLTTNVSPEELVGMFFKMVEPTESRKSFASLPYIKGVTEPFACILKKHDITVVNKPFTTLQQQFPAPRNSDLRWNRRPTSCTKFPVQIVCGVTLGKPAELLILEKRNI